MRQDISLGQYRDGSARVLNACFYPYRLELYEETEAGKRGCRRRE